jgi:hypothetical protein
MENENFYGPEPTAPPNSPNSSFNSIDFAEQVGYIRYQNNVNPLHLRHYDVLSINLYALFKKT